jgi:UDP-N-acetyl-2-amino-2-deoxyglucuronate dehydrogenase
MKDLNVAVIGCGRIAGHHCRNVVANAGLKLTAVCDLDFSKAEVYGKEFSVPAYENYRMMMEKHPEIDIVAVITPSGMHYEHAKEIILNYKKHIIVEKPTFLKLTHLQEIYSCAEMAGVQVFPVFQNRYNKAVQRVRSALANGELGDKRIFSVRVRWCRPQKYYDLSPWRGTFAMDGGAITNQGIHHIDLLRYLGGEVEEVSAQMRTFGAEIEVEDTCVATLKFKSGAIGTLEITTSARPDDFEASISVVGSKGLAQIGGIAVNELQVFTLDTKQNTDNERREHSEDFSTCVYGNGHQMLYADIVKHFNGIQTYPVSKEDAYKTISLLHSFYVSSEKGKYIRPDERLESARLGESNPELIRLYQTSGGEIK